MLSNVVRREFVESEEYSHSFEWLSSPGSGFCFPCNEHGEIDISEYTEGARENLWRSIWALFDEPLNYIGIEMYANTHWEPAYGQCVCGREVILDYDNGHGIDCDCGRNYNMSGQELAPRSQWEDRWDEDSTVPYNVEFGHC